MSETPAEISDPRSAPDTSDLVRSTVSAALDRKAENLCVLDVTAVTHLADYFLVCSAANARQVQAIADAVEQRLRRQARPLHVEGYSSGSWVLLDFGDFVLHVFQEERRGFYGLERLWSDAADVTDRFVPAGEAATRSAER